MNEMKMKSVQTNQSVIDETIKKLQAKSVSRSQGFKELFEAGLSVNEIHKLIFKKDILNQKNKQICYNNIYNVISNYININNIEITKEKKSGAIKIKVIELYLQDKSLTEINRITKTNYNYIWKIVNEYKIQILKEEAK